MEQRVWQQVRDRRLRSDFRKLQDLVRNSDFISVEGMEGNPPETYVLRFTCKGIAQLGTLGPIYSEEHRVGIFLPVGYPASRPNMRWLTPIFHPNINAEGTQVCIDVWYPSKFLDDLGLTLGRMIQYNNYDPNPSNSLRSDAAQWALQNSHLFPVDKRPLRRGIADTRFPDGFEIRILGT